MANAVAPPPANTKPIPNSPLRLDSQVPNFASPVSAVRSRLLTPDALSPVNQNGSFEFDRVIKSGPVLKRTRKTKSWRTVYLVLRPNVLSIYRDQDETKLRHKVILTELTAVARQKDPKGKAKHVFGVFSPARNYHLAAKHDDEASEWVEKIRMEARFYHDEEEMSLSSPGGARHTYQGFERQTGQAERAVAAEPAGYTSSEAEMFSPGSPSRHPMNAGVHRARRPSATLDYSGPEHASYSDFSDAIGGTGARMSTLSLNNPEPQVKVIHRPTQTAEAIYGGPPQSPQAVAKQIRQSAADRELQQSLLEMQNAERIVCQGWLYLLKKTSGVRQWKKLWMVLRPKSLTMYKNEEEYSALKIIPFGHVIDAVEINAVSHSKQYCMQIITEEKSFRLCAPDEDTWARWLGSFKSLLMKRKEKKLPQQPQPQSPPGRKENGPLQQA